MSAEFFPKGVIPAVLLPFDSELRIDESAYRSHLKSLLMVEGITALTVNGHSSEIHALSVEEQRRVLEISRDEVENRVPIIAGVYADGSRQGALLARQAEAAGANCLLVFPSTVFMLGANYRPEMIINHFRIIAESTSLPIIVFAYPVPTGLGYSTEILVQLAEEIPQIVAIKDWCNNPAQHERNIRALHDLGRPFSVLTTHSAWLLASLVMGVDGLLSGAGSVIADMQAQLWEAVQGKDLAAAQAINDRMWQITSVFYSEPFFDMHNRMKEALVLLGLQKHAYVCPPLMKLSSQEISRIRQGLLRAGLLSDPPRWICRESDETKRGAV
jgi:4-hydroxy-tetrahydrodipicolinate synthase